MWSCSIVCGICCDSFSLWWPRTVIFLFFFLFLVQQFTFFKHKIIRSLRPLKTQLLNLWVSLGLELLAPKWMLLLRATEHCSTTVKSVFIAWRSQVTPLRMVYIAVQWAGQHCWLLVDKACFCQAGGHHICSLEARRPEKQSWHWNKMDVWAFT